jgi:hypothetical protein
VALADSAGVTAKDAARRHSKLRDIAGCVRFLTLIHCSQRLAQYGRSDRLDTKSSDPNSQTFRKRFGPISPCSKSDTKVPPTAALTACSRMHFVGALYSYGKFGWQECRNTQYKIPDCAPGFTSDIVRQAFKWKFGSSWGSKPMSGRATARRELYFWTSMLLRLSPLWIVAGLLIFFRW